VAGHTEVRVNEIPDGTGLGQQAREDPHEERQSRQPRRGRQGQAQQDEGDRGEVQQAHRGSKGDVIGAEGCPLAEQEAGQEPRQEEEQAGGGQGGELDHEPASGSEGCQEPGTALQDGGPGQDPQKRGHKCNFV